MSVSPAPSIWSTTFGHELTMHLLLPFSLRVGFRWADRDCLIRTLSAGLRDFTIQAREFDELGLRDLPDSYHRRHHGWLHIAPPARHLDAVDARRREIVGRSGAEGLRPVGRAVVEIIVTPSGLGVFRLVHAVTWASSADLLAIHATQTALIHSYSKRRLRDPHQSDDLLRLLPPIREAILAVSDGRDDPRHQLTHRSGLSERQHHGDEGGDGPVVDFFVGLAICTALPNAPDPPPWKQLLAAPEIGAITDLPGPLTDDSVLSCQALLAVGWDESLLAFAAPHSATREHHHRNAVELFTLGTMQWADLYDTDQLLYEALPFLFRRGQRYSKLQLIRGIQAHLTEVQHEAKVAYLAEHGDDQKILSRMFDTWETDNLMSNLEKKSATLTAIVDRLNDERLRDVGVFFSMLSLIAIVSNLGQHRQWDTTGWLWSSIAVGTALIGWLVFRHFGRS